MQKTLTRAEVWKAFSSIKSTSSLQEEPLDGGDSIFYVNWMDTVAAAREIYPDLDWEHWVYDDGGEAYFFPDKTAEVKVVINIGGVCHPTTLPVTDSKWKAIVNPNAIDINNAKKRCICKALGEMGLYWKLWSKAQRGMFTSGSKMKEAANDDAAPETVVSVKEGEDIEVTMKEFYNRNYDDHLRKIKRKPEFCSALEKIHNKARNLFGTAFTNEFKAAVTLVAYQRKSFKMIEAVADGN